MKLLYACIALSILSQSIKADEISVFIVTGQSNARSQYANGISSALRSSGIWEEVVVYNSQRSGNWLGSWVSGTNENYALGSNFIEDLWASDGSSELQQLIESYESAGHTVTIEGLFWFQGEGDTGGAQARSEYDNKLVWMIQKLQSYYGEFDTIITIIDWNHDMPGALAAIGRTPENVNEIREKLQSAADLLNAGSLDSKDYPRLDVWHIGNFDDSRGQYGVAADLGADEASLFIKRYRCPADLNNDGAVNFFDISLFIQLMNKECP